MTIQFFDTATAEPVTDPIDYEGTVWHEDQLTAEDEEIVEHLAVGEEAKLPCGWTVRRLS